MDSASLAGAVAEIKLVICRPARQQRSEFDSARPRSARSTPDRTPTPTSQFVEDITGIEITSMAGTIGESSEDATLPVGEDDAGHDLEAIWAG